MVPRSGHSELGKVLERQMRNWELARAQRGSSAADVAAPSVAEFVTISREVGTGGREHARLLGERLGWPVFDRGILQAMAGDDAVRTRLYERMDERDVSWLEGALRWLMRGELRREDYFYRLTETVLALARQGHAVFLGRGADQILPRDRGLRVRLVASLEFRAAAFALQNNIPEHMARAELERLDAERAAFRRTHFGAAANDAHQYDLHLSAERFTPEQTVDLVIAAMRSRGVLR